MLSRQLQLLHRLAQILDLNQGARLDEVPTDRLAVSSPEDQNENDVAEQDEQEGPQDVQLELGDWKYRKLN